MASGRRSLRFPGSWPLVTVALLLSVRPLAARSVSEREELIVPAGSSRTGDVVAFGRSLEVEGKITGAAVATFGGVRVTGHVRSHVVAIGGDVVVAGSGRVDGDVLAVGGAVRFEDAASAARSVGGSVRSLGALETAYLSELETSPVAGASVSPLLVSFRLFLLLLWLAVSLVLLRLRPRTLGSLAAMIPGRVVLLGAVGASVVLAGALVAAGLLLLLPARPGLWLVLAVVASLFVAKLLGLAALFLAAGRRLLRSARRGGALFGDPAALAAGLLGLGLPSLVPVIGPLIWGLVSVVAIGIAVTATFVRGSMAGVVAAAEVG